MDKKNDVKTVQRVARMHFEYPLGNALKPGDKFQCEVDHVEVLEQMERIYKPGEVPKKPSNDSGEAGDSGAIDSAKAPAEGEAEENKGAEGGSTRRGTRKAA